MSLFNISSVGKLLWQSRIAKTHIPFSEKKVKKIITDLQEKQRFLEIVLEQQSSKLSLFEQFEEAKSMLFRFITNPSFENKELLSVDLFIDELVSLKQSNQITHLSQKQQDMFFATAFSYFNNHPLAKETDRTIHFAPDNFYHHMHNNFLVTFLDQMIMALKEDHNQLIAVERAIKQLQYHVISLEKMWKIINLIAKKTGENIPSLDAETIQFVHSLAKIAYAWTKKLEEIHDNIRSEISHELDSHKHFSLKKEERDLSYLSELLQMEHDTNSQFSNQLRTQLKSFLSRHELPQPLQKLKDVDFDRKKGKSPLFIMRHVIAWILTILLFIVPSIGRTKEPLSTPSRGATTGIIQPSKHTASATTPPSKKKDIIIHTVDEFVDYYDQHADEITFADLLLASDEKVFSNITGIYKEQGRLKIRADPAFKNFRRNLEAQRMYFKALRKSVKAFVTWFNEDKKRDILADMSVVIGHNVDLQENFVLFIKNKQLHPKRGFRQLMKLQFIDQRPNAVNKSFSPQTMIDQKIITLKNYEAVLKQLKKRFMQGIIGNAPLHAQQLMKLYTYFHGHIEVDWRTGRAWPQVEKVFNNEIVEVLKHPDEHMELILEKNSISSLEHWLQTQMPSKMFIFDARLLNTKRLRSKPAEYIFEHTVALIDETEASAKIIVKMKLAGLGWQIILESPFEELDKTGFVENKPSSPSKPKLSSL